jgi:hypothetical protein
VEVTVTAQIVPVSFAAAEVLGANVVSALERFLHPLPAGSMVWDGPLADDHVSNLRSYPIRRGSQLRSFAVSRQQTSLADIDPPQPGEATAEDDLTSRAAEERRDRFLIFSGRHQITVVASSDEARG